MKANEVFSRLLDGTMPTVTLTAPNIVGGTLSGVITGVLTDSSTQIVDDVDPTKILKFQISGLTTATTRTLTVPDADDTLQVLGAAQTITGAKTFGSAGAVGKFKVAGTTSGSTILDATAVASGTLTLPAATDTLVGKATTDTLTNKTLTAAVLTTPTITSPAITHKVASYSGDGAVTITTSTISYITKAGSAAALSVAAPSSQDGTIIQFTSTTAFAHVITFTGATLQNGVTAGRTTATLPNVPGGSITVVAQGVLWYVLNQQGTVVYA